MRSSSRPALACDDTVMTSRRACRHRAAAMWALVAARSCSSWLGETLSVLVSTTCRRETVCVRKVGECAKNRCGDGASEPDLEGHAGLLEQGRRVVVERHQPPSAVDQQARQTKPMNGYFAMPATT